jgi:hypothetical protein
MLLRVLEISGALLLLLFFILQVLIPMMAGAQSFPIFRAKTRPRNSGKEGHLKTAQKLIGNQTDNDNIQERE